MRDFLNKIKAVPNGRFISTISLLNYLALWYLNPDNKQIFLIFLILLGVLFWKTGNLTLSILLTYILSSVLNVGKSQEYQLLDFSNYPDLQQLYPNGYGVSIIITVADIFSFFMLIFIIKDIKSKLRESLNLFDISLMIFFFWSLFANLFGSKNLTPSLYLLIKTFQLVVLDLYLKFFIGIGKLKYVFNTLIVIILFQSFVALNQFINLAPLGKSIEPVFNPTLFGGSVDEFYFAARPIGTFTHSNNLSVYLASLIPLLASFYLISSNSLFLFVIFSGMVVNFLTLSRTAWIGLFFSLSVYLYLLEHQMKINLKKYFNKKLWLALLSIIPLIIYSFPRIAKTLFSFEESGGAYLRIKQAEEIFKLIRVSPLFGVGNGMTVVEAINQTPLSVFLSFPYPIHNFYILTAAEIGVIGFLLLMLFIFNHLLIIFKTAVNSPTTSQKIYTAALLCSSLTILISGLFQPFLYLNLLVVIYHLKNVKIENPVDYVK